MSQLDSLPTEILLSVAQYLPTQKNFSAFVRTTRRTYTVLQTYLYKNNINNHGSTALIWAAKHGYTTLAKKLLDAGASISVLKSHSNHLRSPTTNVCISGSALSLAARGSHIETLACLLAETRPDRRWYHDQLGEALHYGAIPAHSEEAVKLLLRYNASMEPGGGVLRYSSALNAAVDSRWPVIVPVLLEAGACHGQGDLHTPLERAIHTDQPELVDIFLGIGMRLVNDAALCVIAEQNNQTLLNVFVEAGLEIDMCWQGAFFAAVKCGQCKMVEVLIEKGVNPHLTQDVFLSNYERPRYSAIGVSVYFKRLDVLKLLLKKGVRAEWSDLVMAQESSFKKAVALLSKCDFEDVPEKENLRVFMEKKLRERQVTEPGYKGLEIQGKLRTGGGYFYDK
ncbi:uncharacterized protein N7479_009744 [Penicillium vulpinum]|uniref:F-box domain-containing protein n=1 Tax=Penicillium vulpinum TaxID=29845 RepID=A0A1V6RZ13_9EURO|nr:uncharacterized protein N7479_009744 [Penicillium vulpinum]KAJ5951331.1 hypothetical protein N7479_009744 [Penicillium vulpinum]OQE06700.1 hypothetical protein PENVUL_c017G04257 [Penicillium vulpinum]